MNSSEEDAAHVRHTTSMKKQPAPARLQTFRSLDTSSSESSAKSGNGPVKTTRATATTQVKAVLPSLAFGKQPEAADYTDSTAKLENTDTSIRFEVAQGSASDVSLDLEDVARHSGGPAETAHIASGNTSTSAVAIHIKGESKAANTKSGFAEAATTRMTESSFQGKKNQPPSHGATSTKNQEYHAGGYSSPTPVSAEQGTRSTTHVAGGRHPRQEAAAAPLPVQKTNGRLSHTEEVAAAPAEAMDESDGGSDSLLQEVLPLSSRVPRHSAPPTGTETWRTSSPVRRETQRRDPVEQMLLRARQRLQEKTSIEACTPRAIPRASFESPSSFSRFVTPDRGGKFRESPSAIPPRASGVADDRARRLQQEIGRLQEEVHFLSKENQKLKGATKQQQATQNVELQMTIEVLRAQLQDEELQRRTAQQSVASLEAEGTRMMSELEEQLQSYISTAAQYERLYEEKTRETSELRTQVQVALKQLQDAEEKERQQRLLFEQQRSHDRESAERTVTLLEEAKKQRSHLLELNERLQNEKEAAIGDRRRIKEELQRRQDELLRAEEKHTKERAILEDDCSRLKLAMAEKDRVLSAQLKSAQQANEILQQRLTDMTEQAEEDAERQRRSYEVAKQEAQRTFSVEREQRLELEKKVGDLQNELSRERRGAAERVSRGLDEKVATLKSDLVKVTGERDELHARFEEANGRLETLQETCARYQNEWDSIAAQRRESEEAVSHLDAQRNRLTGTLEQLLEQNDQLRKENAVLQGVLEMRDAEVQEMQTQIEDVAAVQEDMQSLSHENERLSEECERLSRERSALIEENGRIAEEVLKWRNEMRRHIALPRATTPRKWSTTPLSLHDLKPS
ncbi:BRCT domain-containing protein [Trypanosoma grayi]|uniref:BRCT domain-containing protein n=1 Tax=Trypanosoma grayi TaxID=71804 RepID=UPI0004F4BCD6|nr:BRCT domain-containing protein [Trypanosoma grayi]KEG13518.1 BRCT domain-containing protein [Trypanosoma grayi]